LLHLAGEPVLQDRLRRGPGLDPLAVEEFLRLHAPTTMARLARHDTRLGDMDIPAGTRVILPFPAANRDPAVFEGPDEFIPDRKPNPHATFGAGIHKCVGAPFARMELRVAIDVWLQRSVSFRLADNAAVVWVGGQVRGPQTVPVVYRHRP
jgi:cytochrome P450